MGKTILAERIESDPIGLLAIPRHVLYGVHARRAELNFAGSGLRALLDQSLVIATPLATLIGYSKAAYLSKKALVDKRNLRDVFEEEERTDGKPGSSDFWRYRGICECPKKCARLNGGEDGRFHRIF